MGERIRVLHVDDDPEFAELTGGFLEREDDRLSVDVAASAAEGLERLDHERIDCVVSDYEMPQNSGIEFLEAVRERYPDLPFVLFTGKGSEEIASDAIYAGVSDYLQKGTDTQQYSLLANRIVNLVQQYRAESKLETAHTNNKSCPSWARTGWRTNAWTYCSNARRKPSSTHTGGPSG